MSNATATRRKLRTRRKVHSAVRAHRNSETGQKESAPRLSVHRSDKHIYAQIIDDTTGTTLASASTSTLKDGAKGNKTEKATAVGAALAKAAAEKGVKTVVFDRGQFRYHGRVKALAEAAREGGLDF